MSDPIERLSNLFERLPGIGPRQAQRFVQFLLRSSGATRRELIQAIQQLGSGVHQCPECFRYHAGEAAICSICENPRRDEHLLAIVAGDQDLAALESSGTYRGRYFILGGTISLASESTDGLRIKELLASLPIRTDAGLQEIILAFPANPEGDATAERLREICKEAIGTGCKISSLGRGLSTGSELEYADPDTIKSALETRR
ncbi:MAG: toprim domain-containing protein [Patescibacteria group bacterium]|nr:toprim domain-containing protein [bacterium]MDZ4227565.1 toprim domain-containing protein [Patescibacteria group bacterium]